jgi:hypothetical protein
MRRVVFPDQKREIGAITKPVNRGSALVETGARGLLLDADPQVSCARPSDGISLSELIFFSTFNCGCSTDAQSKFRCDTFVQPAYRWPVPVDTELPAQPGTCLSKAPSSLPRILPSRMGTPTRRDVPEARLGSPRSILVRVAPKPDSVWREDNGNP